MQAMRLGDRSDVEEEVDTVRNSLKGPGVVADSSVGSGRTESVDPTTPEL